MAETLNLEALEGYSTGGVLHIIANNQIGFTTEPWESRSTRYASDLAKGFDIPIVHVNADDPEACIAAVRLAMAYREEWRRGVVIDLIGYRRLGPQRGRRAGVHAAAHVRGDQEAPAGAQDLRGPADRPGHHARRGAGPDAGGREGAPGRGARARQAPGGAADRRAAARPHAERGARTRRTRSSELLGAQQAGVQRTRRASTCTASWPRSARSGRRSAPTTPSTGARRRRSRLRRSLVQGHPLRLTGQDTARGTFSQRHLVLRRREDRRAVRADPAPRAGEGVVRDPQQPAVGGGRARLRVRLRRAGARDARDVGGPVRRLRERRAGDGRPVHRVRPRQVGRDVTADAAAAARLRGRRARALQRPRGALPDAGGRGQHPRRERLHDRPSTSTCCAARRWSRRSGR